jgi:hypothetical protein
VPRPRPLHLPSGRPPRLPLHQMAAEVSATLDGDEPTTLLRVTGLPPKVGYLSLDGEHPLDTLLGFTAPHDWLGIGVHCVGSAHLLDPPLGSEPRAVTITALVDRSNQGAGVLRYHPSGRGAGLIDGGVSGRGHDPPEGDDREGATIVHYDEPPEGVVGDACRRALGLPTPPPPFSTAELWLRLWLDEVVEAALFQERPDRYDSWEAVAALHPAVCHPWLLGSSASPGSLGDPHGLAEATLALAERWSWPRLRREPEVVALGVAQACRRLAGWMDDGMFARAVLDEVASLPWLGRSAAAVLPPPVLEDVNTVIMATGLGWSRCAHPARATREGVGQ